MSLRHRRCLIAEPQLRVLRWSRHRLLLLSSRHRLPLLSNTAPQPLEVSPYRGRIEPGLQRRIISSRRIAGHRPSLFLHMNRHHPWCTKHLRACLRGLWSSTWGVLSCTRRRPSFTHRQWLHTATRMRMSTGPATGTATVGIKVGKLNARTGTMTSSSSYPGLSQSSVGAASTRPNMTCGANSAATNP